MSLNLRLIQNPIAGILQREERVRSMAQDLIRFDAFRDERDAIRALTWCGRHSAYDVMVLVDDARQVAMQEIVAAAVSEP